MKKYNIDMYAKGLFNKAKLKQRVVEFREKIKIDKCCFFIKFFFSIDQSAVRLILLSLK